MKAIALLTFAAGIALAQAPEKTLIQRTPVTPSTEYVLGPDDQVKIWALGFEDFAAQPMRIDPAGDLDLPQLGRIHAAGLTTDQLKSALIEKMKKMVLEPQVSVSIVDYGSQPVSVIGAVNQPGIHQLQGRRTLAEMLSMAGGPKPDAGSTIKIVREADMGPIPLPNAAQDPSGKYFVAEVKTADLLAAKFPAQNILIRPRDTITVPPADTISVIGAVQKPGAFPLNTRTNVTALEALAMAGGFGPTPKAGDARIMRMQPGSMDRQEIHIDLAKIQQGKAEDVVLRPYDILLVPTSNVKKGAEHVAEMAVATFLGVALWRGF
jgi:polysaccharide biosynthesis/export protein